MAAVKVAATAKRPRKPRAPGAKARASARKPRTSAAAAAQPARELIARRAYELWQQAFGAADQARQHWLKAESELKAELKKAARGRRGAAGLAPTRDAIASRAYSLWQTAVAAANEPSQHWLEAESQLRSETIASGKRRGAAGLQLTYGMIAARAYEIWQAAAQSNEPTQHWFAAEAQLRKELKTSTRAKRPARASRPKAAPARKAAPKKAAPKEAPESAPAPKKDNRLAA